jgi:uncharacterized NAD(P)/FAD-binding protein YdhS
MPMSEFSVAIIGGGASGLLAAAHLHQRDPSRRIALIERGEETGRGLAYGTPYEVHLLNVRAARMSAFADDDGHFANWLKRRVPTASDEDFAPRRWYGEYLSDVLTQTLASPSGVQTIQGTAVGLERDEASEKWKVILHDGASIRARFVILALGNLPPANPFRFPPPSQNYWHDPWANEAARGVPPDAPVMIIGTGLTMLDLVLALRREGHCGVVHTLSRRGLRPHGHLAHSLLTLDPPDRHLSPRALLRWLRGEVETAAQTGHDWRSVMDGMRPHTRHLWQTWTIAERRSFLRHARPYWDVHRHRCAPEIADQIEALINLRTLIIHRGHIQAMHESSEGIEVRWLTRDERQEQVQVARVINCTGPASNYAKIDLPLIVQMRLAGWLQPDTLHLGIETDTDGRLLGANGQIVPDLFAIGPLRRPSWWESIAIPEIREQAETLAKLIK